MEGLALWSFGTLEVSEGAFGCCKCFLCFLGTQAQVSTKPLQCHDILVLINVDFIHEPGRGNVVMDVLNKRDVFQAMSMTQTLWLMFNDKENVM